MYLCRFAGAEHRRSVGLLTNVQALSADMYLGWPALSERTGQRVTKRGTFAGDLCLLNSSLVFCETGDDKRRIQILLSTVARSTCFWAASSASLKTRSFTAPLGTEVLPFHAVQLVLVMDFLFRLPWIRLQHCARREKPARSPGRFC